MTKKTFRLLNLAVAGMLTGNEFSGLVAVHPALGNLSPENHLRAEQAVYRRYGRIMPAYMTAAVVSAAPVLMGIGDRGSPAFRFTLLGMLCYAAMLATTLLGNVPINRRILELPPQEESYDELLELQRRWDQLHAARNLLNVAGLILYCLGALSRSER